MNSNDIVQYLANGGLIAILSHLTIRSGQRVRLYEKDGQLSYTFEVNSVKKGVAIPLNCLQGGVLFSPQKAEIIDFIKHLGLSDCDAEQVYIKCPKV